jgi:hypothetical protein
MARFGRTLPLSADDVIKGQGDVTRRVAPRRGRSRALPGAEPYPEPHARILSFRLPLFAERWASQVV